MNRRVSVVAALALAGLAVSACSASTHGSPGPATSTTMPPSSAGPTASTSAGDPMAAVDPCTLLDPAIISQNQLTVGKAGTGPGIRPCSWDKNADSNSAGYTIQIGIYDHAGLDELSTAGFVITDKPVGRHQGRLSKDTAGHTCTVSLQITPTSRVDVTGIDGSGNLDAACTVATQVAPSVEQKLPAGNS